MKNFRISLTLSAAFSAGIFTVALMGCASERPVQISTAQLTSVSHQESGSHQESIAHEDPAVSLITLQPDQSLVELVRNAPGVVLIDFYATWCGPCVKQGEVLENLEPYVAENNGSIIKVDVDQHMDLARMFEVTSLPTLILVKDGQIVERHTGLADQNRVVELVGSQLR